MLPQEFFYTEQPVFKRVSNKEYKEFIASYPRELEPDVLCMCEPPVVTMNDFELANRWPYSVIARVTENDFEILSNYEAVFNSKTGNKAND